MLLELSTDKGRHLEYMDVGVLRLPAENGGDQMLLFGDFNLFKRARLFREAINKLDIF